MRKAAVLVVVGALLSPPLQAQELSLDEVLANYYEAVGGVEKIKSINTMRVTGRMMLPQGMEATFQRLSMRPNKIRLEFTVQGITGIQAFDGETAWMLMPFMGQTDPEEMPPDMAERMREEADFDGPLMDHEAKGHQVELVGTEEVEGAQTYKLKVTLKHGEVTYSYLDSEYFLPIKTAEKRTIQGTELEMETILSDYKEVDGLMVPHSIQVMGGPGAQALIIERVEINPELDDTEFAMPKPAAPKDTTG